MSSSAPTNKNVSNTPFVRTMNPALNSYTMSYNPKLSVSINDLYTSSPGEYDYINRRLNTIKEILIENINNQTFSNSTMSDIRRIMAMNSKLLSSINKINNEDLLQLLKKLSPKSREEIDNKIYSKTIGDQKYSKIYRNQALKDAYKAEEMKNIPKIGGRRTRKRSKKTRKTRRHHR